tara:strand:+ start:233 stop:1114 length:882 start_codon:yes stop_codon:yes gene_type:complete
VLDPNKFFKKSKIENRYKILSHLEEFSKLYKNRPIKSNEGGMMFPHMFGLFYVLKTLKPKFVVESGIWKGQSTWLIEKVLPHAKVISIDVKLDKREYISKSKKVTYTNKDFRFLNLKNISKKNSLVFFDDHQNFFDRIIQCHFFGFKDILFDDNYPPNQGDCYSFKKIFSNTDMRRDLNFKWKLIILKNILIYFLKKFFFNKKTLDINLYDYGFSDIKANSNMEFTLKKMMYEYFEFPPIFKKDNIGLVNSKFKKFYDQKKPLLKDNINNIKKYKLAYLERNKYKWLAYVKLR